VHQADDERPPPGRAMVVVGRRAGAVGVGMEAGATAVGAGVDEPPQQVRAERDQHDGDAQLERAAERRRDLGMEPHHRDRGREQRRGVAEPPESPHQRRDPQRAAPADDGRHRRQVVDVERVSEAEHEAEA
jgi:hypothetical protein